MIKTAVIKEIIIKELKDGQVHTANDLRQKISENGIPITTKDSSLRTAIFQLRNSGYNIVSKDRGTYQLATITPVSILKDFRTLSPEEKPINYYIYVHNDGRIVLNSKLNAAIKSRHIEIKINQSGDRIALIENGNDCHSFTKSGHSKNHELLKIIKRKRVLFPATYEMTFNSDSKIWLGVLKRPQTTDKHCTTQNI